MSRGCAEKIQGNPMFVNAERVWNYQAPDVRNN